MATSKPVVSFDEIIQADRKKRKAEQLAQEIFGKNKDRRSSTPAAGKKPMGAAGASLASRMGVQKRSSSTASNNRASGINRGTPRPNPGSNLSRSTNPRNHRLNAEVQVQGRQEATQGGGSEITIRGAAGPYVVVASNFAPGTTAADIESVMQPIGGNMAGCRLVASSPTVIAEMVFLERAGADNVIAMFNNKRADGRVLYVYMKEGGTSQPLQKQSNRAPQASARPAPPPANGEDDTMEVDDDAFPRDRDNRSPRAPRGRDGFARRDERDYRGDDYDREPRRAEPMLEDGRFGFDPPLRNDNRYLRDAPRDAPRDGPRAGYRDGGRMYSDSMVGRPGRGGRGGQSWRP